jgi:hypothetical protein
MPTSVYNGKYKFQLQCITHYSLFCTMIYYIYLIQFSTIFDKNTPFKSLSAEVSSQSTIFNYLDDYWQFQQTKNMCCMFITNKEIKEPLTLKSQVMWGVMLHYLVKSQRFRMITVSSSSGLRLREKGILFYDCLTLMIIYVSFRTLHCHLT